MKVFFHAFTKWQSKLVFRKIETGVFTRIPNAVLLFVFLSEDFEAVKGGLVKHIVFFCVAFLCRYVLSLLALFFFQFNRILELIFNEKETNKKFNQHE